MKMISFMIRTTSELLLIQLENMMVVLLKLRCSINMEVLLAMVVFSWKGKTCTVLMDVQENQYIEHLLLMLRS